MLRRRIHVNGKGTAFLWLSASVRCANRVGSFGHWSDPHRHFTSLTDCGQPTPLSHPHLFGSASSHSSLISERLFNEVCGGSAHATVGRVCATTSPHTCVTPFVTAAEYSERRWRLFAQMPRNSVIVLPLQDAATRANDLTHPFKQESNALYLSGCSEAGAGAGLMPMLVLAKCPPRTFLPSGGPSSSASAPPFGAYPQRLIGVDPADGCELVSLLFIKDKDSSVELWDGASTGPANGTLLFNGWGGLAGAAAKRGVAAAAASGAFCEPLAAPITCKSAKVSNVVATLHALLMAMGQAELACRAAAEANTKANSNLCDAAGTKSSGVHKRGPSAAAPWHSDRSFSALPKLFIKYPTHLNFLGRQSTVSVDVSDACAGLSEELRRGSPNTEALIFSPQELGIGGLSVGNGGAGAEEEDEVDIFSLSVEELRALLNKKDTNRRPAANKAASPTASSPSSSSAAAAVSWPRSALERHTRREVEHLTAATRGSAPITSASNATSHSPSHAPSPSGALSSTAVDVTLAASYAHPWYAVMDLLRSTRLVAVRRGGYAVEVEGNAAAEVVPATPSIESVHCYSYAFPAAADVFADPLGAASPAATASMGGAADVAPNTLMRRRTLFPRTPVFEVASLSSSASSVGIASQNPPSSDEEVSDVRLAYYESLAPLATHLTAAEAKALLPPPSTGAITGEEEGGLGMDGEGEEAADESNPFDFFADIDEKPKSKKTKSENNSLFAADTEGMAKVPATVYIPFICLESLWRGVPMRTTATSSSVSDAFDASILFSLPQPLPCLRASSSSSSSLTQPTVESTPAAASPPSRRPDIPRPKSLAIVKDASPLLSIPRAVKSPCEVALMVRAAMVTRAAFLRAMGETMTVCRTEGDIYRALQSGAWEEGQRLTNLAVEAIEKENEADGGNGGAGSGPVGVVSPTLGYIPVVAAGPNALCIHYTANNAVLGRERGGEVSAVTKSDEEGKKGLLRSSSRHWPIQQWVLVDAGAELEGYACDCSRSWPVVPLPSSHNTDSSAGLGDGASSSGSPHADVHSRLYRTLLHVQRALIRRVEEGLTLPALHREAVAMLHSALTASFGAPTRVNITADIGDHTDPLHYLCDLDPSVVTPRLVAQTLMPHNVGHFIGLDLHERALRQPGGGGGAGGGGPYANALALLASHSARWHSSTDAENCPLPPPAVTTPHAADNGAVDHTNPAATANTEEVTTPPPSDTVPKSLSNPFVGGMMITVEPGLYFPQRGGGFADDGEGGKKEGNGAGGSFFGKGLTRQGIGMRIEDNVLVLPSLRTPTNVSHSQNDDSDGCEHALFVLRGQYISEAFLAWAAMHNGGLPFPFETECAAVAAASAPSDASSTSSSTPPFASAADLLSAVRGFYAEQTGSLHHPRSEGFATAMIAFDDAIIRIVHVGQHSDGREEEHPTTSDAFAAVSALPSSPAAAARLLLSPRACNAFYGHNVIVTTAAIPKDWADVVRITHRMQKEYSSLL